MPKFHFHKIRAKNAFFLTVIFVAFANLLLSKNYDNQLEMFVEFFVKCFLVFPVFFVIGLVARQERREESRLTSWVLQRENYKFHLGIATGLLARLDEGDFSIHQIILEDRKDASIITTRGSTHDLTCSRLAAVGVLEETEMDKTLLNIMNNLMCYIVRDNELYSNVVRVAGKIRKEAVLGLEVAKL